MDLSAIALQGLDQAELQLEKTATRLAGGGALSPDVSNGDTVDLSAEMIALLSARNLFLVELATLKVADEIQKNVIDLMA